MISLDDGKKLIELAKKAVEATFSGEQVDVPKAISKKFSMHQGVFVTLNKSGELRGCIGFPEPVMELYKAIIEGALSAAFKDPRFTAVTEDELKDITFEISVLTVPEEIKASSPADYQNHIKIGRDGLIVRSAFGSGLLLPQVFTEYNSTVMEALRMTCQKAGLPQDSWKNMDVRFYKFEAQIFKEKKPDGEIVEEILDDEE